MKQIVPYLLLCTVFITACDSSTTIENDATTVDTNKTENVDLETEPGNLAVTDEAALTDSITTYVKGIMEKDVKVMSTKTVYPIQRANPQPAIANSADFESRYDQIFDDSLKALLTDYLAQPQIIDRRNTDGSAGILNGLLWFNEEGRLISINYESALEKELYAINNEAIKTEIHPSLKNYELLLYLGKTSEELFRIDETTKGLRLAYWSGDQTMKDKPDFIFLNGIMEPQGTAGGMITTFNNGSDTNYILEEIKLCDNPTDCGDFFKIVSEGEVTSRLPVTKIEHQEEAL